MTVHGLVINTNAKSVPTDNRFVEVRLVKQGRKGEADLIIHSAKIPLQECNWISGGPGVDLLIQGIEWKNYNFDTLTLGFSSVEFVDMCISQKAYYFAIGP